MKKKIALVSGASGQDGSYLCQFLKQNNYEVHGIIRHLQELPILNHERLKIESIQYHPCDLKNHTELSSIVSKVNPDEIYHLAAFSSVGQSFKNPTKTILFNINSTLNFLEIIRENPKIKFYNASSSEMFGKVENLPITEKTTIHPLSPYAVSKASSHWATINYRESYHLFTCSGILFNHESELRADNFFIKKLIKESVLVKKGMKDYIELGNLEVKRDFGYGPKYVEAMWLILQQEHPDDFIICSGISTKLSDIVNWVFEILDISLEKLVIKDELFRPNEIEDIYGDNSKSRNILGWDYNIDFKDVIHKLVQEELNEFQ